MSFFIITQLGREERERIGEQVKNVRDNRSFKYGHCCTRVRRQMIQSPLVKLCGVRNRSRWAAQRNEISEGQTLLKGHDPDHLGSENIRKKNRKRREGWEPYYQLGIYMASATLDECSAFDSANMLGPFLVQTRVNSDHSFGARTANSRAKKANQFPFHF